MAIWGNKIILSIDGKIVEGEFELITSEKMAIRMTKPKCFQTKYSFASWIGYTFDRGKTLNGKGRIIAELNLRALYKKNPLPSKSIYHQFLKPKDKP